jgi:VanZ family protein
MNTQQRLIVLLFFISAIILLTFAFFDPQRIINQILEIDFIGHFIGFYLLTWFLHKQLSLPLINIGICLIFYGAVTELSQLYLGFRNGEVSDFIADAFGVLLYMATKWLTFQELEKENT